VVECTKRCKRLGSRSEVEVFRAEPRQGLLVETLPPGETAQLLTTTRRLAYRRNTSFPLLPSSYS
jgi:hypothetical protein